MSDRAEILMLAVLVAIGVRKCVLLRRQLSAMDGHATGGQVVQWRPRVVQ